LLSTLHHRGVNSSESLVGFFLSLVLVDPLAPIDLDVLVLGGGLEESGPEGGGGVFLLDDEEEVEASFGPFGVGPVDLPVEFEAELVLLLVTVSDEGEGGVGEFDVFVGDVAECDF
jgi:hypothetical protein